MKSFIVSFNKFISFRNNFIRLYFFLNIFGNLSFIKNTYLIIMDWRDDLSKRIIIDNGASCLKFGTCQDENPAIIPNLVGTHLSHFTKTSPREKDRPTILRGTTQQYPKRNQPHLLQTISQRRSRRLGQPNLTLGALSQRQRKIHPPVLSYTYIPPRMPRKNQRKNDGSRFRLFPLRLLLPGPKLVHGQRVLHGRNQRNQASQSVFLTRHWKQP